MSSFSAILSGKMLSSFNVLFNAFLRVCWLKSGPQDVPASSALLALLMFVYVLLSIILSLNLMSPAYSVGATLIDLILTVTLTMAILQLRRLENRSLQTLTALIGTGIVINVIAAPVIYWLGMVKDSGVNAFFPGLMMIMLRVWGLVIMAHILRCALNIHFFLGLLLSLFYYWAFLSVVGVLLQSVPP